MIAINKNQGIPTRLVMQTAKIYLMILLIMVEINNNRSNYELNKKYRYAQALPKYEFYESVYNIYYTKKYNYQL